MRNYFQALFIAIIITIISTVTNSNASPPACLRDDIAKYINSDTVVEAVVTKSRRWSEGGTTLHLVAKYKVIEVFKGDVERANILIVTDTCMDTPVPRHMLGYPVVKKYCRGLIGLRLTGVDSRDGKRIKRTDNKQSWILFLKKDIRKGAPQLTWLEVSETGYNGCFQTLNDIPSDEREGFDRLHKRLKSIGR
jgi:hypothetical protein